MGLQELEDEYSYTDEELEELKDKIGEELETMLEGMSQEEVVEEIDDLDDPEFRELVHSVFENY